MESRQPPASVFSGRELNRVPVAPQGSQWTRFVEAKRRNTAFRPSDQQQQLPAPRHKNKQQHGGTIRSTNKNEQPRGGTIRSTNRVRFHAGHGHGNSIFLLFWRARAQRRRELTPQEDQLRNMVTETRPTTRRRAYYTYTFSSQQTFRRYKDEAPSFDHVSQPSVLAIDTRPIRTRWSWKTPPPLPPPTPPALRVTHTLPSASIQRLSPPRSLTRN